MEAFVVHDLVVTGGRLVLADGIVEADLGVRGGRIATIGAGLEGVDRVSAGGLLVIPGLVDPHVHPIHAESYASVSEAAIHGGVTTVLHHLYTPPTGDPVSHTMRSIDEAEAESLLDFAFHVASTISPARPRRSRRSRARGCTSFKLFMAYGGRGIMVGDAELLLAMAAAAAAGATLLVHAENGHLSRPLEARPAPPARTPCPRTTRRGHAGSRSRPSSGCSIWSGRTVPDVPGAPHLRGVARGRGGAKLDGPAHLAETCPHYLLLTAETAAGLGARAKMAPPLRDQADQDALWRALDRGLIDTVGSDHSAFAFDEKDGVADVFDAGFGVPGIATMLPLLFDRGVRRGRISLERLVETMSAAPARALGLAGRKGSLDVGHDADFVLFDPDARSRSMPHRSTAAYYSLYEGWEGRGVVRHVYGRGEPLLLDGAVAAMPGRGRHLARGRAARLPDDAGAPSDPALTR
jgi:dihydropyrimidinase